MRRTSAPAAFISDLDGTLVDTRDANAVAYEQAFGEVGVPFDRHRYLDAFGLRFDAMMAVLAPGLPADVVHRIADAKRRRYAGVVAGMRVNEGLVRVLEFARSSGGRTALATTARRSNVEAVLDGLGLAQLFDVVITAEDVANGKPAPDCYLAAAEALACSPADCVVFEDSAVGIAAATAAGCSTVRVTL
jgi:beta-phosphoglucomutase